MPLKDRNSIPQGGYYYHEPKLNWHTPDGKQPFNMIVGQIMKVRAQNPNAGLNPSCEACAEALEEYTCKRLGYDARVCTGGNNAVTLAAATVRKPTPCAGCGRRKKVAA